MAVDPDDLLYQLRELVLTGDDATPDGTPWQILFDRLDCYLSDDGMLPEPWTIAREDIDDLLDEYHIEEDQS